MTLYLQEFYFSKGDTPALKDFNGIVVVDYDAKGRCLLNTKLLAGIIPKLATVNRYFWRGDAVEHDDTIVREHSQHFRHNVLQSPAVPSDEYGIGALEAGDIRFKEVAYMDVNAWGTKATGILVNDSLALRSYLEAANL